MDAGRAWRWCCGRPIPPPPTPPPPPPQPPPTAKQAPADTRRWRALPTMDTPCLRGAACSLATCVCTYTPAVVRRQRVIQRVTAARAQLPVCSRTHHDGDDAVALAAVPNPPLLPIPLTPPGWPGPPPPSSRRPRWRPPPPRCHTVVTATRPPGCSAVPLPLTADTCISSGRLFRWHLESSPPRPRTRRGHRVRPHRSSRRRGRASRRGERAGGWAGARQEGDGREGIRREGGGWGGEGRKCNGCALSGSGFLCAPSPPALLRFVTDRMPTAPPTAVAGAGPGHVFPSVERQLRGGRGWRGALERETGAGEPLL